MLAHLLLALPQTLDTVVVTRSEGVQTLARAMGCRCILHREPEVRDTIRIGLEALADTDGCLFCVGDQPLLTRGTIQAVLADFEANPQHIVRAAYAGREGNPAVFPRALYGELTALREGEAGVTVMRRRTAITRTVEAAFAEELTDVDTPDTLLMLEALKQY
jgi:molybdenum cofactor cytidylyltransferase